MSSPTRTRGPERPVLQTLAAWLPAVILPVATLDQLLLVLRSPHTDGVSWVSWALFGVANLGALFIGRAETRIAALQKGLAFGLTALLDAGIVARVLWDRLPPG